MDKRKIANNILEFLIDPTVIPVQNRLYFRPEEQLDNRFYEKAKSDAFLAYRNQRNNSDMYPTRNRKLTQMGGFSMDRKAMIASLDILAKKFASSEDPIAKDLRTMAYCFSKMTDDEFSTRMAKEEEEKKAPVETEEIPEKEKTANAWMDHMKKVRQENPGKSLKELIEIAKKTYKKEATDEEISQAMEMLASEESLLDNWSKEASDAVAKALIEDVIGREAGKIKGPGKPDGTGPYSGTSECPMTEKKEKEDKAEKADKAASKCKKEKEEKEDKAEKADKAASKCKKEEDKAEKADRATSKCKKEEEDKAEKSAEVNTDILASVKIDGIELENGMIASEDIGDLNDEEKSRLNLLFQG